MAGTIFSLGLSQRLDNQGKPEINAPLYIWNAETTTPANVYQDYGLAILHPWPLRTDSVGMIPAFWLADGAYRVRLTDEEGSVVYFDVDNMQALGPSASGGGGGGGSVDATTVFQTGDMKWRPTSGTLTGWVRANGRTIGSATSGAAERANADTQPLYEHLWNNFSNAICAVTGGRGVSAASDFNANKSIAIYTMRGKGQRGLDDMGSTAAGVLEDGTPTTAASSGGSEKLTLARSALPNVTLTLTTDSSGNHTHSYPNAGGSSTTSSTGGNSVADLDSGTTGAAGNHSHSGTTSSINGGVTQTKINTMDPYMLGTFYVKL